MQNYKTTEETLVICADCQVTIPPPLPHATGTGYAVLPDEKNICYSCADSRQRNELLDRSRPFMAYVSGDGKRITSWTGGHLMKITESWQIPLTRVSFTHGKRIAHIHAVDVHGGHWTGRGSAGIVIILRPCKGKERHNSHLPTTSN